MKTSKKMNTLVFMFEVALIAMLAASAYAAPNNMPDEINRIHQGTKGYIDGVCYLVGSGSGAVGIWKFVESQSLKIAAIAGAITILSFKFPTWITAAAVI